MEVLAAFVTVVFYVSEIFIAKKVFHALRSASGSDRTDQLMK